MKKFINAPENLTDELLDGLALANKDIIHRGEENMIINHSLETADRVTIVTQGGSGHEPAISGFVGEGMLDACVAGDIFAAPGGEKVFEALDYVKRDAGTLLITLNHNGMDDENSIANPNKIAPVKGSVKCEAGKKNTVLNDVIQPMTFRLYTIEK